MKAKKTRLIDLCFVGTLFVSCLSGYTAFGTSCTDGTMPAVHASKLSSQDIHKLIEKSGLEYQDLTLDDGTTQDPCLFYPESCLLSKTNTDGMSKDTPVVLLAHGYSATTYEWEDFANYIDQSSQVSVRYSKILLGGHGRSLEEFRKSTWEDWGKPILDEYNALVKKGFTKISLAGGSTACALILEQISKGLYDSGLRPQNVFLIDPIVEPTSGLSSLAIRIASAFNRSYGPTQAFSPEEFAHWHAYRPFSTLRSLDLLTGKLFDSLTTQFSFPFGTNLFVFASQGDPTVNPQGYLLIEKGIKMNGGHASFTPMQSKLHVFTRLSGRPEASLEEETALADWNRENVLAYVKTAPVPFTKTDLENQKHVFDTMLGAMTACSYEKSSK